MEITANSVQTVAADGKVVFDTTAVPSVAPCILTRASSGLVVLRGIVSNGFRARFKVYYSSNIAIPSTGVAGAISLALTLNGDTIDSTTMIVTPTAVSAFFNVSCQTFIDVPAGCAMTLSVENTSGVDISVENANLIVERVA